MTRYLTLSATLLILLFVASPGWAQDDEEEEGPSGFVGGSPNAAPEEDEEDSEGNDESKETEDEEADAATDTGESDDKVSFSDETEHPSESNHFVVAPHVGAAYPAFDELGFGFQWGLELGIMPGFEERDDRPLEIAVVSRFTSPRANGSFDNSNIGQTGGSYSWEMVHQTLSFDGIILWRFREEGQRLVPYALGGLRVNRTRTTLRATADEGAQFGTLEETNTHVGGVAGGGVDLHLGPGTLFSELTFGITPLEQRITNLSSTSSFALEAGYRLFLF